MYKIPLSISVDMYGCPNRCKHCWLGHMPNYQMDENADEFIMDCFNPYFESITFYSWLREPDYCDDYVNRWYKDNLISKKAKPERFELASFYRIVRDPSYISFLKEVGVKKVQLTFFGLKDTQDYFVGRKGSFDEIMKANDLLIENDIIPRWQCFIYENNIDEIIEIYHMAQEIKKTKCPELEFFVHEGSCEGENRKLYPIRINKDQIPEELKSVYLNYDDVLMEKDCYQMLINDTSHPTFHNDDEIVIYISNQYDVYYNFTNMTKPWIIGNLKKDNIEELIRKIVDEDTYALNKAKTITWSQIVNKYGDSSSKKAFSLDDYKFFLYNRYLDDIYKEEV